MAAAAAAGVQAQQALAPVRAVASVFLAVVVLSKRMSSSALRLLGLCLKFGVSILGFVSLSALLG